MTPKYARALLAVLAVQMRETIAAVLAVEKDEIVAHNLAAVGCEMNWIENTFGGTTNEE